MNSVKAFNHFTVFGALTHVLIQNGALNWQFTLEPIPEAREINPACQYRADIYEELSSDDKAYIIGYHGGKSVDIVAQEVLEVIGGGEAVLGAIWVFYNDQGEILRAFA